MTQLPPLPAKNAQPGRFVTSGHKPLMAMVEITNRCNMSCPICFTAATKHQRDLSVDEVKRKLDTLVEEAGPIPLQISGGEPTLHPELPEILSYARSLGFINIELVTNGIVISEDDEYLPALAHNGLTAVYLQFDGLSRRTYEIIRGRDMGEVRMKSIYAIRRAKLCCTLAVAVTKEVNDHELGAVIDFGIDNIDTVRAINFQAATKFSGRFVVTTEPSHYKLSELISLIEEQSGMRSGGFATGILGHPECNAMSLVYPVKGKLEPLFAFLSEKTRRKFLASNQREIILDLFKGKNYFCRKYLLSPRSWLPLMEAAAVLGKKAGYRSLLESNHLLVFAKSFMERTAINPNRFKQCCYGIAQTDGVYSFCAYNNFYRFNQIGTSEDADNSTKN